MHVCVYKNKNTISYFVWLKTEVRKIDIVIGIVFYEIQYPKLVFLFNLIATKASCNDSCVRYQWEENARSHHQYRAGLKRLPFWICNCKDHPWQFALSGL